MSIHKTWSKADLRYIISDLKINIHDQAILNKNDLKLKLINYIDNDEPIDFENSEIFKGKDKNFLIKYLYNKNEDKKLTVKQKNDILKLAKYIIHYCKNGYNIENSNFNSIEEIKLYMEELKEHGDIPSVRKACNLLKQDYKIKEIYIPVISQKIEKELRLKKEEKSKLQVKNIITVQYGSFWLFK
jgi:hypothetical protein